MKIQDSYTISFTTNTDHENQTITLDLNADGLAKDMTTAIMRCINLSSPGYFADYGLRGDLCFVRGEDHPIYFSILKGNLSADEFKRAFKCKLFNFFKDMFEVVGDGVYSRDNNLTVVTCHWSFEQFSNAGEMEIIFKVDDSNYEFKLNIVAPES